LVTNKVAPLSKTVARHQTNDLKNSAMIKRINLAALLENIELTARQMALKTSMIIHVQKGI
jgi:hypothetical protein